MHRDKEWFYLLQKKLGDGHDGEAWKAKMKIEEKDSSTGKSLAPRRIYVCIKKMAHNRARKNIKEAFKKYWEMRNNLVQELVTTSCMKGNKYVLEVKEFIKTPNNFYLVT